MEIYNERVHDLLDLTPGRLQRKLYYYIFYFLSVTYRYFFLGMSKEFFLYT
jgi:hypothetical protein